MTQHHQHLQHSIQSCLAMTLFCFAGLAPWSMVGSIACGQDGGKKTDNPKIEMLTCDVRVVDPDGNPVEDAIVVSANMRSRIDPGSGWAWLADSHGPIVKYRTNANGMANVPYPKYVNEKMEVGALSFSVSHPDFVDFRADRSVDDDPAEIKLERGFRIAVTAVDAATNQRIKTDLLATLSSVDGTKEWAIKSNGMLVSPVFAKRDCRMRVVRLVEGQPTLFSELIEIKPGEGSRVLLKDIKLSPGTRVEGKLDNSVPRPVNNGHVSAAIFNRSDPDDWRSNWSWWDRAAIAEDGTFVFESLPTGEVLQMIPVCDDSVSGKPTKESVLKWFPQHLRFLKHTMSVPQLVELKGESVTTTLAMKKATSVQVTVLRPDGNPLSGAVVDMCPNQLWFDGGSQILGMGLTYRQRMSLMKNPGSFIKLSDWKRFSTTTNQQGIALINNLPSDVTESVSVHHDELEMPIAGQERSVAVELKSGTVAKVTVKMQKKGTDHLGANKPEEDEGQND